MSLSGKLYAWGDKAKYVPQKSGVYALYDATRSLIYIGRSPNLRDEFGRFLETEFSDDPRKRETKYYKREFASNPEERMKELLEEHIQKNGKLPKCNLPSDSPKKETPGEWGFYFYEDIDKPIFESAFNPQDLREDIKKVSVASLEFHQKRGDFANWLRNVFQEVERADAIEKIDKTGEALRRALLNTLNNSDVAACPKCGEETGPVKTWKMAGRPNKTGERLQLTIGHYRCPECEKAFRKVLAKKKIEA